MARIRTIKPEFWTSEQVAGCSPIARLMFVGLWNFCDDAGVHPAAPRRIKMQIFPADSFTDAEVEAFLSELVAADLLRRYTVNGKDFVVVTGWHHQRIDKPTFKYPTPPEFDDRSESIPGGLSYRSATDGSVMERSVTDGTGRECNGRDRNVRALTLRALKQVRWEELDWLEILRIAIEIGRVVTCDPDNPTDFELLLKSVALSKAAFSQDWLQDSVESVRIHYADQKPPNVKKPGYFRGVLKSKCEGMTPSVNIEQALAMVIVPAQVRRPITPANAGGSFEIQNLAQGLLTKDGDA